MSEQEGWKVVSVVGELDLATAPLFRQRIITLVNEGANRLVLDLMATDFLDSIGLGVIVGTLKRLQSTDGQLVVATNVARIRSVFELTRLDQIIPIRDDVDAAVKVTGEAADG